MKKIVSILLLALVTALALSGCGVKAHEPVPLTEEEKAQLLSDFAGTREGGNLALGIPVLNYGVDKIDGPYQGIIVFGKYGDAAVFFLAGQLTVETKIGAAGRTFYFGSSFILKASKGGSFMELEDAYKEKLLTQKDIDDILSKFCELTGYTYEG